jgi:hypothetical protein
LAVSITERAAGPSQPLSVLFSKYLDCWDAKYWDQNSQHLLDPSSHIFVEKRNKSGRTVHRPVTNGIGGKANQSYIVEFWSSAQDVVE